jgi:ABC-type cobalamin/Fe3+-siderophores transport system ATPase subunit
MLFFKLGSLESPFIESLRMRTEESQFVVILGTLGSGKTRTIFENLCNIFMVYILHLNLNFLAVQISFGA